SVLLDERELAHVTLIYPSCARLEESLSRRILGATGLDLLPHFHTVVFSLIVAFAVIAHLAVTARAQQQPQPPAPKQLVTSAPTVVPPVQPSAQSLGVLTREAAVQLALTQASTFQQAQLNEQLAAEDVRQAQVAFLPRLASPSSFIHTSPLIGAPHGMPREPSFIAANAVREYEALMGVTGELDMAGRLRATLRRNRALLEAAHAGTEVARRALAQATAEAY